MAEIGYGYGSEWQLLRMLGHHRNKFFATLKEQLGLAQDTEIHWLDYRYDNNKISGDGEYKKREFFEDIPEIFTPDIMRDFMGDGFGKKLNQNWDGIFWVGKTVYLVEAKAHVKEIISDCGSDNSKSIKAIDLCFEETRKWFGISSDNDWKKSYYQMSNRIAFLKLLHSHGVDAKLVDIYFVNGYEKKVKDPDSGKYYIYQNKNATIEDWNCAIEKEELYLGISDMRGKYIFPVFVNCK